MADQSRLPFHLRGNYAPVMEEVEAFELKVEGALPPSLEGVYIRNGANPRSGMSAHWFMGDGMLHGIRLEGGRAKWYRNRYVRGGAYDRPNEPRIDPATGKVNRRVSTGNTALVRHAGRLFALEEGSFPIEITPELKSVGPHDFDGKLEHAFTAHPKVCPVTGEMFAFGYGFLPPYLVYHRFDKAGRLVASEPVDVRGPTMIHDFCVTRTKAIFFDLPVVFDLELAMRGEMPYHWSEDYPARIGIMPRDGRTSDVRWFDVKPCYIFHPANAYDEGNTVVLEACRYASMWRKGWSGDRSHAWRFTFDLAKGTCSETQLDDRTTEFPRVSDLVAGLKHRYSYAYSLGASAVENGEWGTSIVKADARTGRFTDYDFGPGQHPGEAAFALDPKGLEEDAGYLMTYVYDAGANGSYFALLDAQSMAKGPIAKVRLPQRVPYGFHGAWFADAA